MRNHFLSYVFCLLSSRNFATKQRDVTTSPELKPLDLVGHIRTQAHANLSCQHLSFARNVSWRNIKGRTIFASFCRRVGDRVGLEKSPIASLRRLTELRRRRRKKQLVLQAKQQLCTCIPLFSTFHA